MTEETALMRLAAYCAQGEHCSSELLDKLFKWGITENAQMRIMKRLSKEHYFSDRRYVHAFVYDKLRYNKWGPRKIEMALAQKQISADIVKAELETIPQEEFLDVLRPLLQQKRKGIKAKNDYERGQKLIKFALSRGFGYDQIRQCLDFDADDSEFLD